MDERNAHFSEYVSTLTVFDDTFSPIPPSDRVQPKPPTITLSKKNDKISLFVFAFAFLAPKKTQQEDSLSGGSNNVRLQLLFVLPPANVVTSQWHRPWRSLKKSWFLFYFSKSCFQNFILPPLYFQHYVFLSVLVSLFWVQVTFRPPNGIKSLFPALQTSPTQPCANASAVHSFIVSRRYWKPSSSTGSRAVR